MQMATNIKISQFIAKPERPRAVWRPPREWARPSRCSDNAAKLLGREDLITD